MKKIIFLMIFSLSANAQNNRYVFQIENIANLIPDNMQAAIQRTYLNGQDESDLKVQTKLVNPKINAAEPAAEVENDDQHDGQD